MNKNNQSSLTYLKKIIPSEKITESTLFDVWTNIAQYVNLQKESVNNINDMMLNSLNLVATEAKNVSDRLSLIGSMLADIYSVSGKSSISICPFKMKVPSESLGAELDSNHFQIKLSPIESVKAFVSKLDISAKNCFFGNSIDFDSKQYYSESNIFSNQTWLEIESFESSCVAVITAKLNKESVINSVAFGLINYGVYYPEIGSLETSVDGLHYVKKKIYNSNDFSFNADDFYSDNGLVKLTFEDSRASYVRFVVNQKIPYTASNGKDRYVIGINNLSISFDQSVDNGEVIIGPFTSATEILKASISAELLNAFAGQDYASFSISHDKESWYAITNSRVFEPNGKKVINFNTTDAGSISTTNPVQSLWIKVSLKAIDKSNIVPTLNPVDKVRSSIDPSNTSISIDSSIDSPEVVLYKATGVKYGNKDSLPGSSKIELGSSLVDVIKNNQLTSRALGVNGHSYINFLNKIYTESDSFPFSVIRKCDLIEAIKSESNRIKPTFDFNPYDTIVYKYTKPRKVTLDCIVSNYEYSLNISESLPVLPLKEHLNNGTYYIECEHFKFALDLSCGFFYSSSEFIYVIPSDVTELKIVNELNELVGFIEPSVYDNKKYINLANFFCDTFPAVEGFTFSNSFPLSPLLPNEFSMVFGKFVFGSNKQLSVSSYIVSLATCGSSPYWTQNNEVGMFINDIKEIKASYPLSNSDFKKAVKLKHTNIVKESVFFNTENASINAFIKEVPYINGRSEFIYGSQITLSDNYNKNKIELNGGLLPNNRITFDGQKDLFQNQVYSTDELVSPGDWMILTEGNKSYIKLPDNVYTSDIYDVLITYEVTSSTHTTGGLYSIDYKNGIVYTAAPIDQNTLISYMYSFLFAEYEAYQKIPSDLYSVNSGTISVNQSKTESGEFVALVKKPEPNEYKYKCSPILGDFQLNLITSGNML